MVGSDRLSHQRQLCLGWCPISFLVVASDTRADKILPRILSPASFRQDVVDGQTNIGPAAVLAAVTIAAENVLAREDNLFEGNPNVERKANDAWKGHRYRHGMERLSVERFNQFSFAEEEEDDRFFDVANAQGLVVLIQDEHLPVHFPIRTMCVVRRAEVFSTSLKWRITPSTQLLLERWTISDSKI